ncbi:hypothetical protein Ndes2526B_g04146 [Nannochloris sp. 'desiccata']|nr:hypothetical protein KSW81_001078 [Chlorella desiccata (nom. nud.)]KAH7620230.1 hypothetical protein NADE_002858 [Chlorella desiccata (nom. nud.)]
MFKITLQLADFISSEVYRNASSSEKSIDAVKTWLAGRGSSRNVPWAGIFEVVSKAGNQEMTPLLLKLAESLISLLQSSQSLLKTDQDGGVVLAPEVEAAATESLKLAFFFLCHLTKFPSSWLTRKECSKALVALEIGGGIFEAADKRAAELLLLTTLLEILAAAGPPLSNASLKSDAAATKKTAVDFIAELLCQKSIAPRVLEPLFSLAEQPKQKDSVLKDVASIFLATMQRSKIAGCSVVATTLDRAGKNNNSSSDNLASILLTLTSSKDSVGLLLRASLMVQVKEVCFLLQHPRPAVKKAALDMVVILGFEVATTAVLDHCWSSLAFAAVLKFLHDHDANLRTKALSILENHAEEAVAAVSTSASLESFASSLADCLIDRSVAVRKKAVLALSAIVSAATYSSASAPVLLSSLQMKTMTTICYLLQLPRDSKLYPGESAAATLCTTFIGLAQPSKTPAGALSLLELHRTTPDDSARLTLQAVLAETFLPSTLSSETGLIALLNNFTTRQEVEELRSTLHSATAANRNLAARMQVELSRVAESMFELNLANKYDKESMHCLSKMIYLLGSPEPAGSRSGDGDGRTEAEEECLWLLNLTRSIATQNNSTNTTETLYWCLRSLKLWMQQLEADSGRKLESEIPAIVVSVPACESPDALKTALSLVHSLSNARDVSNSLLSYFAHQAGISFRPSLPVADKEKASATIAFLSTLESMVELYKNEKAEFLAYLHQQQQNQRRNGIEGVEEEIIAEGDAGGTDFCLQAEGEDRVHEAAAQSYLESLLEAQESAPVAFLPALLELAAVEKDGGNLESCSIRSEALKVLGALACLSQPLAGKCIGLVTSLLHPQPEYTRSSTVVTVQAINFAADIIQTFPTAYGPLITSFAPLIALSTTDAVSEPHLSASPAPVSNKEIIAITAAGSFSKLVISNKIKVHECIGILGSGLASTISAVASTCNIVLRQLLTTSSASGDRASIILAIAQQTPLDQRRAATAAALHRLAEADLCSDALVGPCITSTLNTCQPAAALGAAGEAGVQIVLEMLPVLSPSTKMLKKLQKGLQNSNNMNGGGGGGTAMPRALRRELEQFVNRAAVNENSDLDTENRDIVNAGGADINGVGKKRGRPGTATAAKATAVKKLQQDILGLLAVKKSYQKHRASRK